MFKNLFKQKKPNYKKAKDTFVSLIDNNNTKKAEDSLQKLCIKYPNESVKYKKAFFATIKDIDKELAVQYGEQVIKEEKDPEFIKVLATRYKWLGNTRRYNQLMNMISPLTPIKEKFNFLIKEKRTFPSIEKYINLKIKELPEYEVEIKELAFSMLKDIYTKDVMKYAEDVLKEKKNKNFSNVVAARYKRLGQRTKYKKIMGLDKKVFKYQEFKTELLDSLESDSIDDTIHYIDETIFLFPDKKLSICKAAFSILKDKYTTFALDYAEEVIKLEKDPSFLSVALTRCKKVKDREKIYKFSKILFDITKEMKYLADIIAYENRDLIEELKNNLRDNQEDIVAKKIEDLLSKYNENKIVIYKIASDIYAEYNIYKAIEYINMALDINKTDDLYLILFALYIKKGDLNKAVESMPKNTLNKTLKSKIDIWTSNISLLNNGFKFPEQSKDISIKSENKILYLLHNSLPFHSGGYATRAHGLMEGTNASQQFEMQGVSRLGYPKDILKLDSDDDILEHQEIDNIMYHRLKSDVTRGSTTYYNYIKEYGEAVVELAKKENPFVIHAASNLYNGLACVYAAKKLGIKSVYEIRGLWEITRISREPEWIDTDMYKFNADMETTAALNADVVITITEALKNEMISRGVPANKIEVLPNGVVSDRFKPLEQNMKLAKELGLENKIVIGFIGSFVQYEGLEYLVDAVKILVDKGITNLGVLMVGDGAVWEKTKDRVEKLDLNDYFVFTGRVPHEEVEEYYSLVNIAPFPRKGLPVCEMVSPLKPFEAMAMEKAVLSSNVAALEEIVKDGYNGLLFEKDNVEDFADKLEILINDDDLRAKLGKQAREWVIKERDWRVISKKLIAIYDRLK